MDLQFPVCPDGEAHQEYDLVPDEDTPRPVRQRTVVGTDYNLNSPLLDWRVQSLITALVVGQHASGNSSFANELRALRSLMSEENVSPRKLLPSGDHHRRLPELIYSSRRWVKINLGPRITELWEGSREVLLAMERSVLGQVIHDPNRLVLDILCHQAQVDKKTRQEIKTFLNLHYLICMMNARKPKFASQLARHIFRECNLDLSGPTFKYAIKDKNGQTQVVGTRHHVVFLQSGVLVDKNFVLMLKDISLARLMAMCSVVGRDPEKPGNYCANKLRLLYNEGDKLLANHGNLAYKAIKLLESECVNQWSRLGHEHRPLIPESTGLADHLDSTAEELRASYGIEVIPFCSVVRRERDPWVVAQMYGAYRHWGHPYIDSLKGLKKLRERVFKELEIDEEFAEQLGSEMAFLVLQDRFQKERRWYCTADGLPPDSPLRRCIEEGVWPTSKVINDFGDNWHKLNLLPCFEVPEEIDPADLFSDKAHSLPRSKILDHVATKPRIPIPGVRVIETLITTDVPPVKTFLQNVNDHGLSPEDLVIGLKPKERELKDEGRFFSLMGWNLRLYFVITEYLIKKLFVPLFKGLTMADDLNTVTKKMIAATEGQGLCDYSRVYIANSLDYEKWNNNQRYESNQHVFRVMGKFLGLPEIFSLTHKFFQSSLVYYCDRPDLMRVTENSLENVNEETPVCWEGQAGGFEGLRQKGWSIVNYLILRREIMMRNTGTLILAQGDNQIIIPKYKIVNKVNDEGLVTELKNVWDNNSNLMDRIRRSTHALGLTINKDEVVTSAELLVYGKVPIYRGVVLPLETKRWARVSSVTNDQLPSLATAVSSTVTSALAVCLHSDDPVQTMWHYGLIGCFVVALNTTFNPLIGVDPFKWESLPTRTKKEVGIRTLYKDPSVGGVCGSNLFRFLLGRFPDPVCESLSWWRLIYYNTTDDCVQDIALECGHPQLGKVGPETWSRLLEDPTSLNIPSTLSSDTLIKEQVYEGLCQKANDGTIKNRRLRESVLYNDAHKATFVHWLFTITPTFPRFLSEFYTATYFRLTEGIISTFQNSRTIRSVFSTTFTEKVEKVIKKSEKSSIRLLITPKTSATHPKIWDCSASHADNLRCSSWGRKVEGSTIPHPGEMLVEKACDGCTGPHVVAKKTGMDFYGTWVRGPLMPYLGSKTSENTSVLQPWEKNIEIPLLRQACQLRRTIDWLMEPDDKLATSIYNNIKSMTGLDLKDETYQALRTGCGRHRLRSARVSNEGTPSCGYPPLMYVAVTTDSLGDLNKDNHDFMYQSVICWAGVLATLKGNKYLMRDTTHFHIKDPKCLRVISEEKLTVPTEYKFPDVSESVKRMLSVELVVKTSTRHTDPLPVVWSDVPDTDKSWHLGRAQGFLWALSVFDGSTDELKDVLFPISITSRVCVWDYMHGLHRGLMLGSVFPPLFARYGSLDTKAALRFQGAYWNSINEALEKSKLPELLWNKRFAQFSAHYGASVIKSYPARRDELVSTLRQWLISRIQEDFRDETVGVPHSVVVFAEMDSDYVINMFRVAEKTLGVFLKVRLGTKDLHDISYARVLVQMLMAQKHEKITDSDNRKLQQEVRGKNLPSISLVGSEARRAAADIEIAVSGPEHTPLVLPLRECGISTDVVPVEYIPRDNDWAGYSFAETLPTERIRNPMAAGARLVQLSTGAHYKFRDLLCHITLSGDGIFCGDGSGGMGACYLRMFPHRRVIFNSLLSLEGDSLKGMAPPGPGAYSASGQDVVARCINYDTCYQEPSDLRDQTTWENIITQVKRSKLRIGVVCCDADAWSPTSVRQIESGFLYGCERLLRPGRGTAIFKTFWYHILNPESIIHRMGALFEHVWVCCPFTQGSNTSEAYLVGQKLKKTETTHKCLVTEQTLLRVYKTLKASRTYEQEFRRATMMSFELMTAGMESRAPFSDSITIMEFFISLGVKSGLALEMSNQVLDLAWDLVHPEAMLRLLSFLLTRDTVDIETRVEGHLLIPSSTQLQRSVAVIYGLWFGTSLVTRDEKWYSVPVRLYQNPTRVYFEGHQRGNFTYMRWGFGHGKFTKVVDQGERVGVTQSLIRLMQALYRGRWSGRDPSASDTKRVNAVMANYSRLMTCKKVDAATPITLRLARPDPLVNHILELPEE
ncbi:polymerase [Long Island tick rhabdovirus]|uniref:Replicase n=1 Tax=Long Island tick rhabdovirus TaxID=1459044 RepID=W8QQQ8_9RHAB|nr:polymerase [Long Island tick rhabdovirus]AHL66985.1 polymerase [Long Island tick rhabdovirus]